MNVSQERNDRKKLVLKRRITRGKKAFYLVQFYAVPKSADLAPSVRIVVYTGSRGSLRKTKKRRQRPPPPSGANTTGPHLPQEFHGSQRGLSQFARGKIASLCKTKKVSRDCIAPFLTSSLSGLLLKINAPEGWRENFHSFQQRRKSPLSGARLPPYGIPLGNACIWGTEDGMFFTR